jgi:hypothetical protein
LGRSAKEEIEIAVAHEQVGIEGDAGDAVDPAGGELLAILSGGAVFRVHAIAVHRHAAPPAELPDRLVGDLDRPETGCGQQRVKLFPEIPTLETVAVRFLMVAIDQVEAYRDRVGIHGEGPFLSLPRLSASSNLFDISGSAASRHCRSCAAGVSSPASGG